MTAKEIGRRLGLSQSTVSRILSNAPGHRVSEDTRRRVLETAAGLGYRPNAVARSLRQRRTNIVGFYTGYGTLDSRNAFLAEVIGGLLRAADVHRLDLLLHGVYRGASTEDIFNELMDGRIDGLFVHTNSRDPLVARLRESSLPVVAIADPIPGLSSVVCDDADGIRQLVAYLWERGHRCIAYLHPGMELTSVNIRRDTFIDEMARLGAAPEQAPVLTIPMEDTRPALRAIRERREPPTAVCCWNDLSALDLIVTCRELGMSIPGDLAVVGFDGLFYPKRMVRELVTIRANWQRITAEAMVSLIRQMEYRSGRRHAPTTDDESSEEPDWICLPVSLIPGDTV
ncbi:MAG: LacI family DNA-binding transcriptional regulator [Capsulimonadales bacterium]|nr:LacI family DNA-binding transcriptional regulator [Capsulimonadales bacterium]